MSYLVPSKTVVDEQVIKKSRFISYIQRVRNKKEALDFIKEIKLKYPDARHHCWAYIAGHPTTTTDIGFSDDGEPQGTAGKPILNVLQHRLVGEIVLVVVRYFGGIKLGAGGLVRAYSSSAHLAAEKLETKLLIPTKRLILNLPYDQEQKVQRYLKDHAIKTINAEYLIQVSLEIEIEKQKLEITKQDLTNITSGKVSLLS